MSNISVHEYKDLCPIWGTPAVLEIPSGGRDAIIVHSSPRTGGGYEISGTAESMVKFIDDSQKARLTTMLVNRREQGYKKSFISSDDIQYCKIDHYTKNMFVIDRANRLLKYLALKSKNAGHNLTIHSVFDPANEYHDWESYTIFLESLAWSESLKDEEIRFLIDYLANKNFVQHYTIGMPSYSIGCQISIDGYRYLEQNITNPDSSQVFVAMWFGEEMNEIYEDGIAPAINHTGYKPRRIDRKLDVNKIDDEIIAEIRRSRFLVADFTHGDDGARGGVYYEAGFAHGLNIPVIFSCQKDIVDKLHFDTRQYHHIVWETSAELRDNLTKRILALIGQGPLQTPTPS